MPRDGFKACEDCTDFNISTPLGRRPRETLMNVFDFVSDYAGSMIQGLVLSPNEQLGHRLALRGVPACFELLHGRGEDFICLSGGIGGEPLNLTNC